MQNLENEILYVDPPTNRGSLPTYKVKDLSESTGVLDQFLLFDWIQVTIRPFLSDFKVRESSNLSSDEYINFVKNKSYFYDNSHVRIHDVYDLFWYLFRIDRSRVLFDNEKALFGYEHCYSFKNIKIFESFSRPDMGIHICLSGTACREFEDLGLDYEDLFFKLIEFDPHYTRIDVSFDDFTGKYWTLSRVNKAIINNEVITKFRSAITISKDELIDNCNLGKTIQFGNRASDIQFTFYDKLKERQANNYLVHDNIKHWNRFEIRFRNDPAMSVVHNFLYFSNRYKFTSFDSAIICNSFQDYIKSIINNYIRFSYKNSFDSNRWRWPVQKWWSDFLDKADKIRFQRKPIEYSISKKRLWLDRSCSYSNFLVMLSDIKDFSCDEVLSNFLYSFFKEGSSKISIKDLQYVNEYRIAHNLQPITIDEVNDYVDSVKEILLIK